MLFLICGLWSLVYKNKINLKLQLVGTNDSIGSGFPLLTIIFPSYNAITIPFNHPIFNAFTNYQKLHATL